MRLKTTPRSFNSLRTSHTIFKIVGFISSSLEFSNWTWRWSSRLFSFTLQVDVTNWTCKEHHINVVKYSDPLHVEVVWRCFDTIVCIRYDSIRYDRYEFCLQIAVNEINWENAQNQFCLLYNFTATEWTWRVHFALEHTSGIFRYKNRPIIRRSSSHTIPLMGICGKWSLIGQMFRLSLIVLGWLLCVDLKC